MGPVNQGGFENVRESSTCFRRQLVAATQRRVGLLALLVALGTVCLLSFLLGIPSVALVQAADDWMKSPAAEPVQISPVESADAASVSTATFDHHASVPPWLTALTSTEARVRRQALERLDEETEVPSPALHLLVARLAASDPNLLVQGRAELLMIEWGPVPPQTSSTPSAHDDWTAERAPETTTVLQTDAAAGNVMLAELTGSEDVREQLTLVTFAADEVDLAVEEPSGLAMVTGDEPDVLYRPLEQPFAPETESELLPDFESIVYHLREAPTGYSGRSSVLPSEGQTSGHFVPIEDRWRVGLPYWDRYDKGHPPGDDYQYVEGHWWDPYNQNVLKGDYPVIGQHTFLNITAQTVMLNELRNVPTGTTPFESTVDPYQAEFFGNSQQYFYNQNFKFSLDLFHGNAAFKPVDWRVKITPVFNLNYLDVNELGVVGPDVRAGTTRARQDFALEEWFVERKLLDIGPDYDFLSVRTGSQFFSSDFRGFIFNDTNRGLRFFGTRNANRDQFNLAAFDMLEKETNSQLNSPHDREQTVVIANYYRQDFIFPGYTASGSLHYNNDGPSTEFDQNDFLARPDPTGSFREHRVEAYYLGFSGDGHMGRFNVSNAFYWALGRDSYNPLAGREQSINAQMAALELSYDRDWVRFRSSFFWSSGDDNLFDKEARGFDTIIDNPAFAGGGFSYWQRQNIRLFGVGLTQRESFVPNLRSSKTQGQANFVNPGLFLYNIGLDADITPKVKLINNINFLWFHKTEILERFVFQDHINHNIGVDMSTGVEYRPFLNDNVIIEGGMALFQPGSGFKDLFGKTDPFTTANAAEVGSELLYQAFMDVVLTF